MLNAESTAEKDRIFNKLLEKDRNLRYQHASDIRADLQRLKRDTESGRVESASRVVTQSTADMVLPPSHGSSSVIIAAARQHRLGFTVGFIALLLLIVTAGFGFYSFLYRPKSAPFQKFTITQITNSGKATRAAISPDGRYVLSVMNENGQQSLWLRNVPTGSNTQIISPSSSQYEGLAFSPDGNYIYFMKVQNANYGKLYRAPVLGGTSQQIVDDIDSDITFSPDGKRMAYVRSNDPDVGKYRLLTASLDGTNETVAHVGEYSESPGWLAWSSRKDAIYATVFNKLGSRIDVLDLKTGRLQPFLSFEDKRIAEMHWSPDDRSLIAAFGPVGGNIKAQIGFIRNQELGIEPITHDTNRYWTLTLSADGKTIATVLARSVATVSVLSLAGDQFKNPRTVFSQTNGLDVIGAVSWNQNGSIILANGESLTKLDIDDKSQPQLLADPNSRIGRAVPCGKDSVVFSAIGLAGSHSYGIWRLNAGGSRPLKLADVQSDGTPVCSADQKWVYFLDEKNNHISRVPSDGSGKAETIFDPKNILPSGAGLVGPLCISADGRILATFVEVGSSFKTVLFYLGQSNPPKLLDVSEYSGSGMQFTPNGDSLLCALRQNGVDNIWLVPLDGSVARPVTNFQSEEIWSFSLSRDGANMAVLRGHHESDVVLLQESLEK